jgi:hypothetical protein
MARSCPRRSRTGSAFGAERYLAIARGSRITTTKRPAESITGTRRLPSATRVCFSPTRIGVSGTPVNLLSRDHHFVVRRSQSRQPIGQAQPDRACARADAASTRPSIIDYKHMAGMLGVSARMRDEALHTSHPVERFAGSGRIRNLKDIDMTDPQNLAEYERALNEEIERQKDIMRDNDSVLPRWIRHRDSVNAYNFADGELQNLLGAKDELALFRQDVQRYNERQEAMRSSSERVAQRTASGTAEKAAPGFNAVAAGLSGTPAPSQVPEQTATMRQRPARPITPA